MLYRNTITGAIIDVKSKISGENWVEVEPQKNSPPPETKIQEKKTSAKKPPAKKKTSKSTKGGKK